MRARIQQRRAFFLGVLMVGCALIGGRPAHAGPIQEQKKEQKKEPSEQKSPAAAQPREEWWNERDREEGRQREERRRATEAAEAKEAASKQQQQHAPEIDGSSIPTALALMGASVLLLRARLRST